MNLNTEEEKKTKIKKKTATTKLRSYLDIWFDRPNTKHHYNWCLHISISSAIALDSTSGTFEYNYSNRNHIKFMIL